MDSVIKEKWLTALRSGKYKQGRKNLRTKKNEFCCLGVLCDIYRKETNLGKWVKDSLGYFHFENTKKSETRFNVGAVLPFDVAKWAGLSSSNPEIFGRISIAGLNDKDDSSFKMIADKIEKHF